MVYWARLALELRKTRVGTHNPLGPQHAFLPLLTTGGGEHFDYSRSHRAHHGTKKHAVVFIGIQGAVREHTEASVLGRHYRRRIIAVSTVIEEMLGRRRGDEEEVLLSNHNR